MRNVVVGLDEVGRGALAGPVFVGAVIMSGKFEGSSIKDSKLLTPLQRENVYREIIRDYCVSFGIASAKEVDIYNVLNATKIAARRALASLSIEPTCVLIDGNTDFNIPYDATYIVGGDRIEAAIAAASIIAKVRRDKLMGQLHLMHSCYDWKKNKGYPTKAHLESIKNYGITVHHRRSFNGVKPYAISSGDCVVSKVESVIDPIFV